MLPDFVRVQINVVVTFQRETVLNESLNYDSIVIMFILTK